VRYHPRPRLARPAQPRLESAAAPRHALERNEKVIAHWVRVRRPQIKKARQLKAWWGSLDESAFSQRPPVRASWAPKGRTPCLREPFNWQRLSGIGLVLTTPTARRLRWFLTFQPGGIRSVRLVRFLNALRRHSRHRVPLLWGCLPAHRSRLTQSALGQHRRWLRVEWLP
jgi:hypothetical protein